MKRLDSGRWQQIVRKRRLQTITCVKISPTTLHSQRHNIDDMALSSDGKMIAIAADNAYVLDATTASKKWNKKFVRFQLIA